MSLWDESQTVAREHVDSRYGQLLAELEAARQEIARLQGELAQARDEAADAREQVADRDAIIATLRARIAELEAQIPKPVEPTPGLWYRVPEDPADVQRRPYLLHVVPWMTGLPRSTWEKAYLAPGGESGKHAAYGGYVRDMPTEYAAADDVEALLEHGVDGVFVDLVAASTTHSHWPAVQAWLDAAAGTTLRVIPMIDTNGSGITSATPGTVASHLNRFLDRPSAWRLRDGRYVVGAFKAEGWTADRFTQVAQATGKQIAYVGAFNDTSKLGSYSLWSAGAWSPGADPALLTGIPASVVTAQARGQVPLMPLLASNYRPAQGWYDESRGLSALRASWDQIVAVGDCVVQGVTLNDVAEGSGMLPSALHGDALLAYSQWRSYGWRTGTLPPILTPTVFVSHRPQLLGATLTGGQTKRMVLAGQGVGPSRPRQTASVDEVEVLTLLPAAARVTVTVGPATTTYDAPAGEYAHYVPARAGTVSVSVAGVEVVSPIPIATRAVNDAPVWVTVWSGDSAKVFDPRPAA